MLTLEQMIDVFHPFPAPFNRREFTTVCPRCGRKNLHVNLNKEVFNCYTPTCEVGGGATDFWALCRNIEAPSKAQVRELAKKDFKEYKFSPDEKIDKRAVVKKRAKVKKMVISREEKHKTYKALFGLLKLSPEHKQMLLDRGFTEEQIVFFGFKSYPNKENLFKIPAALLKMGCILDGVAGFYKENGNWRLVEYPSGIIIPQLGLDGLIRSFQVRQDRKNTDRKYLSISSARFEESGGTKGMATFHYVANDINARALNLIITEGPLKGDLIFTRMELPVLAIQGVSSIRMLKDCLLKLYNERGLRNIALAFDMDKHENENVKKGVQNITDIILGIYDDDKLEKVLKEANKLDVSELTEEEKNKARCFRVIEWEWLTEFKGLDDYLV